MKNNMTKEGVTIVLFPTSMKDEYGDVKFRITREAFNNRFNVPAANWKTYHTIDELKEMGWRFKT